MPVPSLITDLSTTAATNSPAGSENVFPSLDDYLRAQSAFLASVRDNSGNGWVSPYLPLAGGTMTGTVNGLQMASANGGQLAGLRNRIINGDMSVAQRGTTGALTTGYTYISVDRFAGAQSTAANGVLARVAASLDGFQYAAKIGRTAASTNTGSIILRSALETTNSVSLQGQQVTLSFYAKAGANFSAASSNITAQLFTGTGTDQSVSTMNTWTGSANPINTATAITTSWVRYSFTATLSSTATQVGITVFYTPVGTAGADDNLYVTGVQLEVGPIPTIFEQIPIGLSLQLCQRYFEVLPQAGTGSIQASIGTGQNTSTTGGSVPITFKVTKRTTPGVTSSGLLRVSSASGGDLSVTSTSFIGLGLEGAVISYGVALGLVQGYAALFGRRTDTTGEIRIDAEL